MWYRDCDGRLKDMCLRENAYVFDLMNLIKLRYHVPKRKQLLRYGGVLLEGKYTQNCKLRDVGITHGATILVWGA